MRALRCRTPDCSVVLGHKVARDLLVVPAHAEVERSGERRYVITCPSCGAVRPWSGRVARDVDRRAA